MGEIDWEQAGKAALEKVKANQGRATRDRAAFDVKLRNMKSDSDVLKEIAKLLFSIDQRLKG